MKRLIRISYLLGMCVILHSCAKNPVTGKRDFMLLSESQEIAKGQQMAAISHRKNLKYEFKIVDSPVVNAFAVPGGYVYFTRGIMAHFNNEAQFMGVLGHETGHITARHSVAQQRNALLGQLGLIAGMVIRPEF